MKAPITAAQAMQHPTVVETINTLSQLADKLRVERDALLDRVEKAEKDAERLDWLEQNLFNRENVDWITGKVSKTHNMWVTFAPVGVQGSARRIIDSAMEASK